MDEQFSYDYRELAFDLLLPSKLQTNFDDLMLARKHRGMTQSQLADEMGSQSVHISQIETDRKRVLALFSSHRLRVQEVGARIKYVVEPAEKKPKVIGITSLDKL